MVGMSCPLGNVQDRQPVERSQTETKSTSQNVVMLLSQHTHMQRVFLKLWPPKYGVGWYDILHELNRAIFKGNVEWLTNKDRKITFKENYQKILKYVPNFPTWQRGMIWRTRLTFSPTVFSSRESVCELIHTSGLWVKSWWLTYFL